ncbi:hypothetical protein [Streptomyces abyssomicinicus]|uniref:hypothetical protein n=1 Tax=Streptomyces abyssomicinicus TaxID=574929 RepID=UPI0012505DFD|nr:hypothetical protein [Streptomyces abyssomicinicus]
MAAPPRPTPAALRAAVGKHHLLNLTGPLGSGKSWLAARLPQATVLDLSVPRAREAVPAALAEDTGDPLVLDSVDGADALAAVEPVRSRPRHGGRPVLLVSRCSLLSRSGWTLSGTAVLSVSAWPDERIGRLAADTAQVTDAQGQDLVVRLAAGNPMIAAAACRALHAGVSPRATGAVADVAAQEITDRLARELPTGLWQPALDALATMWAGDETLLGADRRLFDAVGGLSVVHRTELGLAVAEPFRSVVELAHRWRRPVTHRGSRTRTLAYRKRLLATEPVAAHRSRLAEGIMALSDSTAVRETFFPASPSTGTVRPATPGDSGTVGELMYAWARHGGLDTGRTDRMVERWLHDDPAGFHLVQDPDGRAMGLAGLFHVGEHTINSVETLLQEHTDELLERRRSIGTMLLGAAYCPDRGMRAQLLRCLFRQVVSRGQLLTISTPSPDYQRLLRGLRFHRHGTTTDDIYRCGRKPEIYSQDFGPHAIPAWVDRLAPATGGPDGSRRSLGREVGRALADIHDAARLSDSPLLSTARTSTVADLQSWLRENVRALAASDVLEDAEAGWILLHYYLGRRRTHQQLTLQLHLSRATYFRRLRHGLDVLGSRLAAWS